MYSLRGQSHGIIAQLGEHLPYKQRVIGSSPIGPITKEYGEIAQLARACGSYPQCRGFESPSRYLKKEVSIRMLFLVSRMEFEVRDTAEQC